MSTTDRNAEAAYGPQEAKWDGSGYLHIEAPGMRHRPVYAGETSNAARMAHLRRMDESPFYARDCA